MSQTHRSQTPGANQTTLSMQPTREALLDEQQRSRLELKKLRKALREKDEELQTSTARNKILRTRLEDSRSKELALRQTNQMLIDMVKGYADREASVLANVRTLWRTYQTAPIARVTPVTAEDVFD